MLESDDTNNPTGETSNEASAPLAGEPAEKPAKKAARKAPAKKAAAKKAPAKKAAKKSAAKKADAPDSAVDAPASDPGNDTGADTGAPSAPAAPMVLFKAPEKKTAPARKRTAAKTQAEPQPDLSADAAADAVADAGAGDQNDDTSGEKSGRPAKKSARKPAKKASKKAAASGDEAKAADDTGSEGGSEGAGDSGESDRGDNGADNGPDDGEGGRRRPRRRGGRRRRKAGGDDSSENNDDNGSDGADDGDDSGEGDEGGSRRRRTRVRQPRNPEDEITSIGGSTRLEAKKQRRREGREAGRRRAPIVSEAEFLARREAVDRVMVIRQREDLTQIGVIEDKVLVEHYVARESQTSLIGNIYLGRVQNVLPSMEAAFIDIGKGRNAVIYAGEVNWKALGHKDGQQRKIESVLSSGQTILVQVTKDPVGHKGARLTGQISLPGRFLVYVPDGTTSGISRKLPDTERNRLKTLLKEIVPDTAGVIVRTAAEGASEEELTHDVERLTARWADIEGKVKAGKSPELLYGEPDLTLKVVRDLFTEDFTKLVIEGDDAWDLVDGYVSHVAPDLRDRLERFERATEGPDRGKDIFAAYRVDEQIAKGLDRKVWLPSGGSLIIDRTEAMTVVDVNTGKFTGSGGNLEETVTKNNLEAAEEMVRQLRLRDIGGIIVIDFIDMVLESNRDLVLRRLVECLGRDRTRHQVAEVTSLGLVQMTRKRIGTGLLEAFGEDCPQCKGRGVVVHDQPIESGSQDNDEPRSRRGRGGRNRSKSGGDSGANEQVEPPKPSPKVLAGSKPPTEPSTEPSTEPLTEPVEAGSTDSGERPEAAEPAGDGGGRRRSRRQDRPARDAQAQKAPDQAQEQAPEQAQEQAPEQAPEQAEPAPAPIDTTPKVVTTTRRRAARPAGPPVTSEPAPEPAPEPDAEVDVEAVDAVPLDVEADAAVPGVESADGEESGFSLLHVPIKRKGTRKR